ncbi:glycosyltransferase [uncultured Parabacteroides sp.]|uniref:glycosyltransferase n=1 Tax=uncultured Parabacteroides sp. TaxID=512312 RepID=UPI002597FD37|nr:glycosyltransferase [uncultured Parabacteroides sp.]
MHILHTISSFGLNSGGTTTCSYDLLTALNQCSCKTDMLTLDVQNPSDQLIGLGESWIKVQPFDARTPFLVSSNLKQFLLKEKKYDLYHTNGLWLYCNHITASVARKKDKPYLISLHGMLYPQALARSRWKKVLMRKLYFDEDLVNADCIHVTCREEMEYYRLLGFKNPVAVVPNLVLIPKVNVIKKEDHMCRVGYLGRLHPRKHVERLIYAVKKLEGYIDDIEIVVMGNGDESYISFLKQEVKRLNLSNVSFVGFISGNDKYKKLASLSVLCVPSDFENFGMIITEALSVGTPVIASKCTPWEELNTHRCGWWVDNDVDTLAVTIRKALELSEEERIAMGERGRELVKENYSVEMVGKKMKELYKWILYGGQKPEFVYLK